MIREKSHFARTILDLILILIGCKALLFVLMVYWVHKIAPACCCQDGGIGHLLHGSTRWGSQSRHISNQASPGSVYIIRTAFVFVNALIR